LIEPRFAERELGCRIRKLKLVLQLGPKLF
jgi:hypothetical protein